MFFRDSVLPTLLLFPLALSAFQIDSSCRGNGGKDIEQTVRAAMSEAFHMVDSAIKHLNQETYDQDTEDLIKRLFIAKTKQNPRDKTRMTKVMDVFQAISRNYRNERALGDSIQQNDVIIFCDDSRYVLTEKVNKLGRSLYKETTTGRLIPYEKQTCHNLRHGEKVALAITDNAESETTRMNGMGVEVAVTVQKPTQIQICPWFVDWIKGQDFKTGNDVTIRSNIGRGVIKMSKKFNWPFTEIDAFSLLDKVLLHEMTHGRTAFSESLAPGEDEQSIDDVPVPKRRGFFGAPSPLFNVPSYGWKYVMQLAELGDDVVGREGWSTKAADHNADSYALFGSAARLLDHTSNPMRVAVDGKISKIA